MFWYLRVKGFSDVFPWSLSYVCVCVYSESEYEEPARTAILVDCNQRDHVQVRATRRPNCPTPQKDQPSLVTACLHGSGRMGTSCECRQFVGEVRRYLKKNLVPFARCFLLLQGTVGGRADGLPE